MMFGFVGMQPLHMGLKAAQVAKLLDTRSDLVDSYFHQTIVTFGQKVHRKGLDSSPGGSSTVIQEVVFILWILMTSILC